ncbi:alpha-N-acetylglucosaminidase TIM-barrel domain-containing protein [[Ruminococcus] torques]|uniref:alpha-N-acetylglucosaminidase TIM-barrel domain-containing protein n=1 Tax=[Ruminococcus] torques TaxID=33039 RepID=UPI003AB1A5EC
MQKKIRKIVSSILASCMVISAFAGIAPQKAEAKTTLVNVAVDGKASTESGQNGEHVIGNINDGDPKTSWQTPGTWPATAVIQLDKGRSISKVAVELGEDGDNSTGRTALVTVKYAQNGITTDLVEFGTKRMTVDSKEEFIADVPKSATHIYVTLSDPQNSDGSQVTFWPSVQEVEVFEEQEEKVSDYNNIANQAKITTDGNEHPTDGSAKLVDGDDKTLYKFHNAEQTSEKYIALNFDEARTMDAFRIAFEHVGDTDGTDFAFEYSILAKKAGDSDYTKVADHQTANRTDNYAQVYKFNAAQYSEVKIVMHSCKTQGGTQNGWPAVAEFEVYGSEIEVQDTDSIAFKKPVHTPSGKNTAKNITDGSKKTQWTGAYYPSYVDIDLEKNYNLDTVEVYTPENGYSQYTIYTSMDGRDFDKLAEKTSKDSCDAEKGEVYQAEGKEARIVRVYMEYNSASTAAVLNEVRVTGKESKSEVQKRPEINTVKYEESEYNVEITEDDTKNEVYGIIERRLGEAYKDWFKLELAENPKKNGYDYFELSMDGDQVKIKGNDGVSLATGLNHYLKYFCQVNLSQVGDQADMPENKPVVTEKVFKETKAEVRYSYNYCTLSYSMAFWGEQEWRDELDWLALNGVNVVLDATAQEEVWRRFLGELGYSHEDIKDFIAGPAYYAWAYMANLSGFGGPVHDSWFEERTELARKNQLIMRKLGMQPVLQGYSGMVPTNIHDYDKNAEVIEQGEWCSFQRPTMLKTTSSTFEKYAKKFYQCQKEVYGDVSNYYATDPFHEGGITGGMNASDISEKVLTEMITADKDAVWIIQSWQGNPTTALLNGLDRVEKGTDHALILDLYAEKDPHYDEGRPGAEAYGDEEEFDKTPWLFCMLNNFGGRLGLHGHLDNLANNIPKVFNETKYIAGIGITPEASVNNPVLYDFLFETIWQDDASQKMEVIDLDTWLDDYATRRYGAESESANQAWDILKETVYKASLNGLGQGAPESVVNARPNLTIGAASTWGNAVISYEKGDLEEAAALLLADYDKLKDSAGYQYDLANVLQQVLSNSAQEYQKGMSAAFSAKDLDSFKTYSEKFMSVIEDMEKVTGTSEYFLLGRWVEQAKALANNADDFTKELYEFNAKALVTTWGSKNQAEKGGLKDYSNRQWSGLIGDFYKARWQRWITARTNELSGTDYESNIDWFEWEWEWVRSNKEYPTTATPQDLKTLGAEILENYSVKNPAANDEFDLPTEGMTATAGSAQPQTGKEGPASYVLDKDVSTLWHSKYEGDDQNNLWIDIALGESKTVNGLRILPRNGAVNGVIVEYRIEVSNDNGQSYHEVATGTWTNDSGWKWAQFDQTEATNVRLYAVRTLSDQAGKNFASAAEIRIMAPKKEEPQPEQVNKQFLEFLIGYTQSAKEKPEYEHVVPEVKKALDAALAKAVQVKENEKASQEQVDAAYTELLEIVHMLDFTGDTTNLKILVDAVSDKTEDEYTPSTWQPFKNALDAAKEVLKDENALDADIEAARAALETAANGLVKRADFTELQAAVDAAKKAYGDLSGYTEESAAAYTQALTAAEAVLKNADASQTEVDQAKTDLETAISGLTAKPSPDKVDKTALQSYVDFAKKYADKEEEYTPSTWNAFKAAYDKAQEVLEDDKAVQKDVDDALDKLQKAVADLRMKPSKEKLEELKKAIKAAESKDLSEYTDESVEAYKDVVEKAKAVLSDKEATAKDVEDMLKTLKDADKLLVEKDNPQEEDKKPSKEQLEALKEAIKAAEKKDLSGYTDASVKAYKDVLEKAKAVLEDKKATAKDVEDMLKALKDAEKLLVKKDDVKEDEDKNPDSQKGQAVQTGDQTPIMFWAFMLAASAVVIFRRRKRA